MVITPLNLIAQSSASSIIFSFSGGTFGCRLFSLLGLILHLVIDIDDLQLDTVRNARVLFELQCRLFLQEIALYNVCFDDPDLAVHAFSCHSPV